MQRTELVSLYKATPADGTKVTVCGWAKTVRDSKNIGFISLSDGSCYKPVQIVFQADKLSNYAEIAKCGLYTSFEVTGTLGKLVCENDRLTFWKLEEDEREFCRTAQEGFAKPPCQDI